MHIRTPTRGARGARSFPALVALVGLALLAGPLQAAERLQLRFVQPEQFADIGRNSVDREQNLRYLRQHVDRLGQGLPSGQRLEIEVLDVDLAGEVWPFARHEVRVLRGGADGPHIHLRYTLRADDTLLAQGEERLSDLGYLFTRQRALVHRPLPYEQRMLDAWFRQRFPAPTAAAR